VHVQRFCLPLLPLVLKSRQSLTATDPKVTPSRFLIENVTVLYRDFRSDERAIEAPLFTGQAKHGNKWIGIKKLVQFKPLQVGFCLARAYTDERMPNNPWVVMSLAKDNGEICQACSDKGLQLKVVTVAFQFMQMMVVLRSTSACSSTCKGPSKRKAAEDADENEDVSETEESEDAGGESDSDQGDEPIAPNDALGEIR